MEIPLKKHRLPDTELARIAPLAPDARRKALLKFKNGFPDFSYEPTRRRLPELTNAQPSLLSLGDTEWSKIESGLKRLKNEKEAASNIEVAELLYNFIREEKYIAVMEPFGKLQLGAGVAISYWSDAIFFGPDGPTIFGFDFRRAGGFNDSARRFAFSAQHEHIRQRGDDYATAKLGLVQFPALRNGTRKVRVEFADQVELIPYDELIQMARETYSVWFEILEQREDEARKTGTGGSWWDGD
ncbi:hypothetical protein EIB18_18590 [Caulobacter vibrioides]|uniref:Uncharacterized protein n=1 Tax=Caulobacter vibrioides (strain ATCC 19089 / CIP 103742 / CB 15) TaxID=190650 RepID=Q9A2P2_CAUVC|nr:hypothetical protein CC_3514 [Caulobacter vibrioides CB15]ATC30329.1 hypothetical protein CA607_18850 [Caulobacter vibrioides]AZH14505.1 hypothetical protein EIB18_18590 [Caulobacter vibrioides]